MLVISVIMAININAELSMILLIIVPIIAITLFFILRYVHPLMEKVFRKYDDLNEVVEENVSGIRVVKSFVIEEKEKKKFGKVHQIYIIH